MTLNDFRALKDMIEAKNVIFCYNGYLSQEIIVAVSSMIKGKLSSDETKMGISQKVLYMFVEQAQNITRYSPDQIQNPDQASMSYGSVAIGTEDDKFYIMCSNRIEKTKVAALKEKLDLISSMSPDELKALYKEKMRSEAEEGSKGASVGFIEMARKSSEPIEFDFLEDDETYDNFTLKVVI
ncbi:SiaB family protein kinase [Sulfuricurvum sp.]|uniref:SiaB family protein kinase n=1 Tax=Sulfuricurvum sp. TaxID=2025608 RepID=UPI003C3C5368